ncbi:nuclear transport factor 2 family protein [Streptomyces sp. NPDC002143]
MADDVVTVVRKFLDGVFSLDGDAAVAQISDDVTMEFALAPDGLPRRLEGKQAADLVRGMLSEFWSELRSTRMDIRREVDPERVVAEYASEGTLANGKPYVQNYAGHFTVRDGKIIRYAEYCDPFPVLAGMETN